MLVIAFGNPLRQDDGVGLAVARALEARGGVDVRAVHQLMPELADDTPTCVFRRVRRCRPRRPSGARTSFAGEGERNCLDRVPRPRSRTAAGPLPVPLRPCPRSRGGLDHRRTLWLRGRTVGPREAGGAGGGALDPPPRLAPRKQANMTTLALAAVRSVSSKRVRRRMRVRGAVQGVGFRPFVYRLARSLDLTGFVANSTRGVTLEVEGRPRASTDFGRVFEANCRPGRPSSGSRLKMSPLRGPPSSGSGRARRRARGPRWCCPTPRPAPTALPRCFDPDDRRYRYPFTNCTDCGPRYSIVLDLPYDRARTTMARFAMCRACRARVRDARRPTIPRRAQRLPRVRPAARAVRRGRGAARHSRRRAARRGGRLCAAGRIVAVKGIGGFHLLVDARDEEAVRRAARAASSREAKPLAVMAPSLAGHASAWLRGRAEAACSPLRAAPIVLLRPRPGARRTRPSRPGSPASASCSPTRRSTTCCWRELGFPVVATSGNLSRRAHLHRRRRRPRAGSRRIADLFLVHDRPIARPVDDSVARVVAGRPMLLRRARGYAPLPVATVDGPAAPPGARRPPQEHGGPGGRRRDRPEPPPGRSRHAMPGLDGHRDAAASLDGSTRSSRARVACDLHPDYASTRTRARRGRPRLSRSSITTPTCSPAWPTMASPPPVLGFAWDGSGLRHRRHGLGRRDPARARSRLRPRSPALRPFPPPGRRAGACPRAAPLGPGRPVRPLG